MKRVLFAVLIVVFGLSGVAFAGGHHENEHEHVQQGPQGEPGPQGEQGIQGEKGDTGAQGVAGDSASVPSNRFGAKLDVPDAVHIKGDWYLGAEGGKDLNYTSASNGWFGYIKVTNHHTFIDFDKK